jgi:hypothetical protein
MGSKQEANVTKKKRKLRSTYPFEYSEKWNTEDEKEERASSTSSVIPQLDKINYIGCWSESDPI